MKAKDLREKSVVELEAQVRDNAKTLFKMLTNKTTGEVEKTHLYVQLRRDIARIKTILRQKQTAAQ
jgi:large subunit ribosomal protein L29